MRSYYSDFDLQKLKDAEQKLQEVCDYYYGDSKARSDLAKLQTIVKKLGALRKNMEDKTV